MDYLICQDWKSTSGNHAGIKYLCEELERRFPDKYVAYCRPDYRAIKNQSSIFKIFNSALNLILNKKYNFFLRKELITKLNDGDRVFFMEYLLPGIYSQLPFAKIVKKKSSKILTYGMVHFVPSKYDELFSTTSFKKWDRYIDKYITLGNSLSDYFIKERKVDDKRVVTTFHYVDNNYYTSNNTSLQKSDLTVIVIGNMKRNYQLLIKIVENCPQIKFIICQGRLDLHTILGNYSNVSLISYVDESKLRELMSISDVSLNVMDDTIGSNVIVTSLAMGLAMICSDVGSIRDYCDESNTIFCNNEVFETFLIALNTLNTDRSLLYRMKNAARSKSYKFSIDEFSKCMSRL